MGAKGDDIICCLCFNVNGLKMDSRGGDFNTLWDTMDETQVDIAALQEHNLNFSDYYTKSAAHNALDKQGHYALTTASATLTASTT